MITSKNSNMNQNFGFGQNKLSGQENDELIKKLADVASNLRILEDRYGNLRRKTQLTDQVLIDAQRNFSKEKRIINDEITEIKESLFEIKNKIGAMGDELENSVSMNDYLVLEKYLELWNPIKFVTRKQLNDYLEEKFKK